MPETEDRTSSRVGADVRELAIAARRVDIRYRVYEEARLSARSVFSRGMRTRRSIEVHAVKDLSFDLHVGDALGIVGHNGSGKSTLLRAIAGLQALRTGKILVRGEVGLLGVGAALKPTLSGYRNIMLGGLALGMKPHEVEARTPEIEEFAGIGEAMARPLATYSSGMRARLAFAIATLRVPDILLIDEALAVGDKDFRLKSLARLNEIRSEAGTIVMVTHNLGEIRSSCNKAMWMEAGRLQSFGDVETVLEQYENSTL